MYITIRIALWSHLTSCDMETQEAIEVPKYVVSVKMTRLIIKLGDEFLNISYITLGSYLRECTSDTMVHLRRTILYSHVHENTIIVAISSSHEVIISCYAGCKNKLFVMFLNFLSDLIIKMSQRLFFGSQLNWTKCTNAMGIKSLNPFNYGKNWSWLMTEKCL